jgi:hypothetical protein
MPIMQGIRQCSYIWPEGRRCGSPAVSGNDRCFHHHRSRKPDPLAPELQELVALFSDADFHDYCNHVVDRCANGTATLELVQDLLSAILGFDVRTPDEPLRTTSPFSHLQSREVRGKFAIS